MNSNTRSTSWIPLPSVVLCFSLLLPLPLLPGVSAAPAAPDEDLVTLHGRVLDPSGKPVDRARVTTIAYPFESPLSETKSAPDGSFTLSFRKSRFAETFNPWQSTVVAATSDGFGPGWAKQDHVDAAGDVVLTLARDDIPIEGRIVDLEGRPVAGVSVTITTIRPKAVDLKKLSIDRSDPTDELGEMSPTVNGLVLGACQTAASGPDGRFRFTGIGRDRTIGMIARGGGIANASLEAATRDEPTQTRDFQSYIKVSETIHGARFEYAAAPGRSVSGTVRDAVTRAPLAGVAIKTGRIMMDAVTDAQGHYRVDGLGKEQYARITAVPNETQPYLMRDADAPLKAGFGPITIDFELHRGVMINGKITDTGGKPVGAMDITYTPYLNNPFAKSAPEFVQGRIPGDHGRYYSKADGSYRVVGVPGAALICLRGGNRPFRKGAGADLVKGPRNKSSFQTYQPAPGMDSHFAVKEVDIPADAEQATVDLVCDPGLTLHLHLTDAQGKPLAGAAAYGHIPQRPYERLKTADVDVVGLAPSENRTVYLVHKARGLGKILTLNVSDAPDGELTVRLDPMSTVSGRLIARDGQPMGSALVQASYGALSNAGTDSEGRFKLTLLSGKEFSIRGIKGVTDFMTEAQKLSLPPGTSKDLGDVHVK